jgi:hypothetical protein
VTLPSPLSNPEAWDRLVIGGVEFRGAFEFSGDALKRKLDHRHSASRDGARIRDRGYDLAKIKLSLRCYEDEHFEDLEALVRLLFPRDADATRRAAYACTHPALAVAGITEVYAESMDVLHMVEERGRVWGTTIDLVEYRPEAQRRVGRTVQRRPDLSQNRTAFTGLQPIPPPAAPSTSTATTGPRSR